MNDGTANQVLTTDGSGQLHWGLAKTEWNDSTGYIIAADALANGDTVLITDDGRIVMGDISKFGGGSPKLKIWDGNIFLANDGTGQNGTTVSNIQLYTWRNGVNGSKITLASARGTVDAPLATEKGDVLGEISLKGYNGSSAVSSARITALAANDFTTTNTATSLGFNTSDTSVATLRIRRMTIEHDGHVGIHYLPTSGMTVPEATNRLHVSDTANPIRIEGLQLGGSTDSVLVTDGNGVVKLKSASSLGEWSDSTGYIIAADALLGGDTVVITDDGRIGVGISTPTETFHLKGTTRQEYKNGSGESYSNYIGNSHPFFSGTDVIATGYADASVLAGTGGHVAATSIQKDAMSTIISENLGGATGTQITTNATVGTNDPQLTMVTENLALQQKSTLFLDGYVGIGPVDPNILLMVEDGINNNEAEVRLSTINGVQFRFLNAGVVDSYFFPKTDGTANQVLSTDGAGNVSWSSRSTNYTPTSSADTNGEIGDVAYDANYIYVKTAAGWRRTAAASW